MSFKNVLVGSLALAICTFASGSATPTSDAMRAAAAVQTGAKYSSCVTLTKDADGNIISFHVNGICPEDVGILLKKDNSPLTSEYTIVQGTTKEGTISTYMFPTNIATAQVVEAISKDLVNAGSISIQITKQANGKT